MEEPWSFTVDAKRSQKRARFNMLALEHDEYYFQVLMRCQISCKETQIVHLSVQDRMTVMAALSREGDVQAGASVLGKGVCVHVGRGWRRG